MYKYTLLLVACMFIYTPARADMLEIIKYSNIYSKKYQIDPILVQAIIKVESNGNKLAVGKFGEIGLMQLRPEFHHGVSFDTKTNIAMGVKYLAYVKSRCPNKEDLTWVTCYNKGTKKKLLNPTKAPYYKKVIREYARLINESSRDRPRNGVEFANRISNL